MYQLSAGVTAELSGATLVCGASDVMCSNFCIDSREVTPGSTFVAFVGEQQDGNAYAIPALEAGAACVVVSKKPWPELLAAAEERGACVLHAAHDSAEDFLLALAGAWRARFDWLVIAVTGSVGKTTTKDMVAAALEPAFHVHKNEGNFNSVVGVPLTILKAPANTQVFVCEMGMNHPGEIERIAACARPQLAIITNVGTSHIGLLGSREAIARAKAEVVPFLTAAEVLPAFKQVTPALFMNPSDEFAPFIAKNYALPARVEVRPCTTSRGNGVTTCKACKAAGNALAAAHAEKPGELDCAPAAPAAHAAAALPRFASEPCTPAVAATNVRLDEAGHPSFDVEAGRHAAHTTLRLTGEHVVADYVLALGAALAAGANFDAAVAALEALEPAHMRQEVTVTPGGITVIDDSYNASPASLAAALAVLAARACKGRRIAVLGEVGELGSEAPRLHAAMGGYVAAQPLDLIIFVGSPTSHVHEMAQAARSMGFSADCLEEVETCEAAARVLCEVVAPGDVVLAKGSRSVGLDAVVKEVLAHVE